MMASGNNMVLRFTSMKSPQHLLKRLAAHGLPRQGLRQLRSSHHHAGRSTKVTVKLRGLRHYHGKAWYAAHACCLPI